MMAAPVVAAEIAQMADPTLRFLGSIGIAIPLGLVLLKIPGALGKKLWFLAIGLATNYIVSRIKYILLLMDLNIYEIDRCACHVEFLSIPPCSSASSSGGRALLGECR